MITGVVVELKNAFNNDYCKKYSAEQGESGKKCIAHAIWQLTKYCVCTHWQHRIQYSKKAWQFLDVFFCIKKLIFELKNGHSMDEN